MTKKKKPEHKLRREYKNCEFCGKKCKDWYRSYNKYFCSINHADKYEDETNSY